VEILRSAPDPNWGSSQRSSNTQVVKSSHVKFYFRKSDAHNKPKTKNANLKL